MTREEAIKDIQDNILPVVGGKSLTMAISALRQPDPCGDVVSRNAIIQKLNKMDRYVSTELRLCDTDKKFPQNEVFIVDDVYEGIVEQLPSIQPERKTGQWIPTADGKGRHECSQCHEYAPCYQDGSEHLSTFCVLCGAKMEGGEQK